MSLYILGAIQTRPPGAEAVRERIEEICSRQGVRAAWRIDGDDKAYLSDVLKDQGSNVYFMLGDDEDPADATAVWIEAMTVARNAVGSVCADPASLALSSLASLSPDHAYFEAVRCSRLGGAISLLICHTDLLGCLAIIDGAPVDEMHFSRVECEREILKSMLLPWDCVPNHTYVWS